MKISDILEKTAAQYESGECSGYSCWTISTNTPYNSKGDALSKRCREVLEEMGLDVDSSSAFDDVPFTERSKARMMWLEGAAMVAREQGL